MFKLQETSIPTNLSQVIRTLGWDVDASEVSFIYDTTVMAISDYLGQAKSKDTKTALAVKDLKGNVLVAGIVAYHKNEDEEMPGNWSYEFTFSEDDLQGCDVRTSTDPQFQKVFQKTLKRLFGLAINEPLAMQAVVEESIKVLSQWLDVNAKDNEEITVEQPGFFVASVSVENGEKIYAIVPDGAMKRLIKDDAAIEA